LTEPPRDERIRKRSALIAGHATSFSLEDAFWNELLSLAAAEGLSINQLVTRIDATRTGNLSSALRLYVLRALKQPRDSLS
jgi:predicted DNA-binding ribbon-helix-helix protein